MRLLALLLLLSLNSAFADSRYRIHLTDPRIVSHTKSTIGILSNNARTDIIGYTDLTNEESNKLKTIMHESLMPHDERMPFVGVSPIYLISEINNEKITPIAAIGLQLTWADKSGNICPRNNKIYTFLRNKIPPPAVFDDIAPTSWSDELKMKESTIIAFHQRDKPFYEITPITTVSDARKTDTQPRPAAPKANQSLE